MLKDKRIVAVIVVIVLLVLGGAYFMLSGNSASDQASEDEESSIDENVASLKPSEVGLEMEALSGNKQVVFRLTKPEDITAVEYELTYIAEDEQQRGVIGTIEDLDSSGGVIESKPLDLGSCSSGVCKYDKGVSTVDLLLKITKGGKDYQVKDTLSLE
jgi:hypothetical protein